MSIDKNKDNSKIKVLLGMADSIDSYVAAHLLKKQNYQVMAFALINWSEGKVGFTKEVEKEEVFEEIKAPRCHIKNLSNIEKFCEKLNIPLYVTDANEEFADKILDNAVSSKIIGKTYQTCFRCTKFKLNILHEKAKLLKCDYISTPHYAKVYKNHSSNEFFVYRANDLVNDQSYKLSSVPKEVLSKLMLPLSELKREEVLKIGKKFNFEPEKEEPNKKKLCFVYEDNFTEFVESKVSPAIYLTGDIVDYKSGKGLGEHRGLHNYFEGQKNLVLKESMGKEKYNVIDISENSKTVSLSLEEHGYSSFHLYDCEIAVELDRSKFVDLYIKIGFKNELLPCKLVFKNSKNSIVYLNEEHKDILGNSLCVIYSSNKGSSRIMGYGFIGYRGEIKYLDRVSDFREENDDEGISDSPTF